MAGRLYLGMNICDNILHRPFLMYLSFVARQVKFYFVCNRYNVARNTTRPEGESSHTSSPFSAHMQPERERERERGRVKERQRVQNKLPALLEYSRSCRRWPTCPPDSVSCRLHQNHNKYSLAKLREHANVLVESCMANNSESPSKFPTAVSLDQNEP